MRVFKYEILKYAKNKAFVMIFVALLLLCAGLFYFDITSDTIHPLKYKELHSEFDSKSAKEVKSYIQDLQDTYTFYEEYEISLDIDETLRKYEQSHGSQWVANNLSKLKTLNLNDLRYSHELQKRAAYEIHTIENYASFRFDILEQVSKNQEISIFKGKENTNSNKKIAKAYEKIEIPKSTVLVPTLGIEKVLTSSIPTVLCLIFLLYMIGILVYQERKRGFSKFTKTMIKGKRVQYFSKLGSLIVVNGVWLLCAYVLCTLIASFMYSFPSIHTQIQSIPLLMKSVIDGNLLLLTILFLFQKLLVLILITSLCYVLALRISAYPLFLFFVVCIFGISFVCYSQISELSGLVTFKYMNVYAILQHTDYLGNYIFFTIFNQSISLNLGFVISFVAVSIILVANAYLNEVKIRNKALNMKVKKRFQPRSLLVYECKKVWIKDFGILIFAVLVILQVSILANTEPNITIDDIYYNNYIDSIGDTLSTESDEKLKLVALEYESMQSMQTDADKYKSIEKWNRYPTFIKYQENYAKLEDDKDRMLLKENEYSMLFEDSFPMLATFIIVIAGLILVTISSFYREKETRMDNLQYLSIRGGKHLWNYKMVALLSFCIPLCLICYGSIIWRNQMFFNHLQYASNIMNIDKFQDFGISISIKQFLFLMMSVRIVYIGMLVPIISVLSKKIHNRYEAFLVMGISCIIGFLVTQLSKNILLNPLYSMLSVSIYQNISQIAIGLIVFFIIGLFCFKKGREL